MLNTFQIYFGKIISDLPMATPQLPFPYLSPEYLQPVGVTTSISLRKYCCHSHHYRTSISIFIIIPTNLVGQLVEPLLNNHPDQPIRNELELRPRGHLVPDHRLQLPDLEVARQRDVMMGCEYLGQNCLLHGVLGGDDFFVLCVNLPITFITMM